MTSLIQSRRSDCIEIRSGLKAKIKVRMMPRDRNELLDEVWGFCSQPSSVTAEIGSCTIQLLGTMEGPFSGTALN